MCLLGAKRDTGMLCLVAIGNTGIKALRGRGDRVGISYAQSLLVSLVL
jgi:hypothetical protein